MLHSIPLTLDSVIRRPASDVVTQYGLHICYIYDSFDLVKRQRFIQHCVCDSQLIDLEVSDLVFFVINRFDQKNSRSHDSKSSQ
ncbi:unnamed protein product [Rhizophagus irregularis]|nr:unnamed protein product [Rhizophagus irregularis]